MTGANLFLQGLPGYSHAKLLGKTLREIAPFRDITAWDDIERGKPEPLQDGRTKKKNRQ